MGTDKDAALRKRQQIDSSKRTMFITVAIVGFVTGTALVVSFFLLQQIWFHAKVIGAKQETLSVIKNDITTVKGLKDNVRVLDTNEALNSVRINDSSSALQSILDALPAEANADALGASLQERFIKPVEGLSIESLAVDSMNADSLSTETDSAATTTEESSSSIGFTLSVSGSADGLKELLARFERSIRVIKITSVDVQAGEDKLTMNIVGKAFYEPARKVEIGTKVLKP